MKAALNVPAVAWPYLIAQRGDLWQLREDRAAFLKAWRASLAQTLDEITPWLPASPGRVLDIGSGLGGIDVLLSRNFGCAVSLLDGEDAEPVCTSHDQPFGARKAALAFQKANGVEADYLAPLGELPPAGLVVSFCAWGFHIEPSAYLSRVREALRRGGTLIVDLRREKPDWMLQFAAHFDQIARINRPDRKFDTWIFRA